MATPLHVHHAVTVAHPAEFVRRVLVSGAEPLVRRATEIAAEQVADLARRGGFDASYRPDVTARLPDDDELGALVATWSGDEEATGWPTMSASLVPTLTPTGTSLVLLSPRYPGYDVTTNRVDKVWRDRLTRTAMRSFLVALVAAVDEAAANEPTPAAVGVATRDEAADGQDLPEVTRGVVDDRVLTTVG